MINKLSLDVSIIDAKATKEELHTSKKLLTQLSETENQCTLASDCIILPIGARACGGPSDYIVYSKSNAYADYIVKLAALTSELEKDYNKDHLTSAFCPEIVVPTGMCSNNMCKQDKLKTIVYGIMYPLGRS